MPLSIPDDRGLTRRFVADKPTNCRETAETYLEDDKVARTEAQNKRVQPSPLFLPTAVSPCVTVEGSAAFDGRCAV